MAKFTEELRQHLTIIAQWGADGGHPTAAAALARIDELEKDVADLRAMLERAVDFDDCPSCSSPTGIHDDDCEYAALLARTKL